MPKLLKLSIENCGKCPYRYWDQVYIYDACKLIKGTATVDGKFLQGLDIINDPDIIHQSCPLPDLTNKMEVL